MVSNYTIFVCLSLQCIIYTGFITLSKLHIFCVVNHIERLLTNNQMIMAVKVHKGLPWNLSSIPEFSKLFLFFSRNNFGYFYLAIRAFPSVSTSF